MSWPDSEMPVDIELTDEQRRILGGKWSGDRSYFIHLPRAAGRAAAQAAQLAAHAATPEDAAAAARDLQDHGITQLDLNGKHLPYDAKPPTGGMAAQWTELGDNLAALGQAVAAAPPFSLLFDRLKRSNGTPTAGPQIQRGGGSVGTTPH